MVYVWFDFSNMIYDGQSTLTAYRTAGWFYLGLPGIIGFAFVYSMFFTLFARRLHMAFGWSCLLVVAGCMTIYAIYSTLPSQRLARAIGKESAMLSSIHHLHQHDTFNGGTMTHGIITGPDNLMDLVIDQNDLVLSPLSSLDLLRRALDEHSLPDYGEKYENERLTCYQHPQSGKIYFAYRSALPRRR